MPGFVIAESAVEGRSEDKDTAFTRTVIDASRGSKQLEQRVTRYRPGRSRPRSLDGKLEVLYVVSGAGTLHLNGRAYELEPDTGAYVVPGERCEVDNPGPDELVVVSVVAPAPASGGDRASGDRRVTVRYRERPALPAAPNREFRYLVNEDLGCREVTQFVGVIPPGRAPMHSHSYDEVVYVIEGEGVLHLSEEDTPLAPGTCLHLPPLHEHCLENTGPRPLRVLGVFHPAGSPASKAYEGNK